MPRLRSTASGTERSGAELSAPGGGRWSATGRFLSFFSSSEDEDEEW